MGLPLWPNYKEEEQKAGTKNAVKIDPTAAARSSIRRRGHRRAGDSSRSRGLTGAPAQVDDRAVEWDADAQETVDQRAPPTAPNDPTSQSSGPAPSARPIWAQLARERQPMTAEERELALRRVGRRIRDRNPQLIQDVRDRVQRREHELNSQVREIPRLRRETTLSSGLPGSEARPATLPTPPLEVDSSGSALNGRPPSPPSAPQHGYPRPPVGRVPSMTDYVDTMRRETDGLGDRARSISAGDDTGDHWEIIRTTIPEDEAIASADSSFAGTAAADSLASTDPARNTGDDGWPSEYTPVTEPSQGDLHEPQTEECWDFYSESDDPQDVEADSDLNRRQTDEEFMRQLALTSNDRRIAAHDRHIAHNEGQRIFRRRQTSQLRRLNDLVSLHGYHQTDTGSPSPGAQRPDRYSAELLQRSRDVANDVREFVRREREALNHHSTTGSRPTQIADTRSDMQSSADLLGTFSESMRHDDNDLEAMRGIVQRMVAREDIPDEFWLSAGLSRDTVRGAAPAGGRPSTSGGMRLALGRDTAEVDGYSPSD